MSTSTITTTPTPKPTSTVTARPKISEGKFNKLKSKYMSHFAKLFPGGKKHRTALVAAEFAAFEASDDEVKQYAAKHMGIAAQLLDDQVNNTLVRFQIANNLHELYFDEEAADIRRGMYKIGEITSDDLVRGAKALKPYAGIAQGGGVAHADTRSTLEIEMEKRRAFIEPTEAERKQKIDDFEQDWGTMETKQMSDMNMRMLPPNTPAPPPPAPVPSVKVPVTKETAPVVAQEASALAENTVAAASVMDEVSKESTEKTFNRTLNTLFQGDAEAKMTQEEKEITKALMKTSAGVLRESFLKLVEEKSLKMLNEQKIKQLEAENAKMRDALQSSVVANVNTVAALEATTAQQAGVVNNMQNLANSGAVTQAAVDTKTAELSQMNAVLENKKTELNALANKVDNLPSVIHYKTISPLETAATPAVEIDPMDFSRVVPPKDESQKLSEMASEGRKNQVRDFGHSASRIIKTSGKSAGSLFSKIMKSSSEGGAKLLPVLAESANKIIPEATKSVSQAASGITNNAPAATSTAIDVVSKIQDKRKKDQRRKDRAAKKSGTSSKSGKSGKSSKPKKKSRRKSGKRGIGDEMEIGEEFSSGDESDDLIGEPMDSEDYSEYSDDDIGEEMGIGDKIEVNQIGIKKLIGEPEPEEAGALVPLNPNIVDLMGEKEPGVTIDPRGMLQITYHPILPADAKEFQFPAHLSAASVLSLVDNTNLRVVILQRLYLFCLYYPRNNPERAKDMVALKQRIDEAIHVTSKNTEIEYDESKLAENEADSTQWVMFMKGANVSSFPEFKKILDFVLYLVLVLARSDPYCLFMYHFIFDYSPSMPYARASEISYAAGKNAPNVALISARFKEQ